MMPRAIGRRTIIVFAALLLSIPPPTAVAGNDRGSSGPLVIQARQTSLETLANRIQARYEAISDLKAEFSQNMAVQGFQTLLHSSGRVHIKKPGKLYWEYRDPQPEHIYVNGDRVRVYVPEHNQVIESKLSRIAASRAPVHLLQGAARLSEHFDFESADSKTGDAKGLVQLGLRPKDAHHPESTRRIVIGVDPESHYIRTLVLYEANGNITTIAFSEITVNSKLPDSLFECEMPADVEIVPDLP